MVKVDRDADYYVHWPSEHAEEVQPSACVVLSSDVRPQEFAVMPVASDANPAVVAALLPGEQVELALPAILVSDRVLLPNNDA